MIAPPEKSRGYWTGEGQYENAEEHEGTWWEDWREWLEQRSGEQTDAPRVGSEEYPPIEDAPGIYVREMHEDAEEGEGAQGAQVTQEATHGGPRGKEWDESKHTRDAEGRFT
jgi:hypothetical protein